MIDLRIIKGVPAAREALSNIKQRGAKVSGEVTASVSRILSDVRENGDEAVLSYGEKFDGIRPEYLEVPREIIENSLNECGEELISALKNARERIYTYHACQNKESWFKTAPDGSMLGQTVRGLHSAGIYVPGGTAAYPSTVLMCAVPAKIAGVDELCVVTPPRRDGSANPAVLAACAIAGVDRVFLTGGAQAIGALAFGTATIPKVDKIVGPGNIYVTTAKKLVYGEVDIDMLAGPSEILIIADETAEPAYLAADLMSQAEHDKLAGCILVTTSEDIAAGTLEEIQGQSENLPRREIIKQSLENYGLILVTENMDEAVDLANEIASEHVEIMTENPIEFAGKIVNAGALFLGKYSPEPLGDYYAGPSHVLPTGGTARFYSPLSVDTFLKKTSLIYYSKEAFEHAAGDTVRIANEEGLEAHANSIIQRCGASAERLTS